MTPFALILFTAALGFVLSRVLRVPTLPVLMMGGVVTGHLLPVNGETLQDILILGVSMVVFAAGVELNPSRVGPNRSAAIHIGLLQFGALGALGAGVGAMMGLSLQSALYLSLALTASSTLVVVRILQQRQQMFEPIGRTLIGVLLLQDLLVILAIPAVTRLPLGLASIAVGMVGTASLLALSWIFLKWVTPQIMRWAGADDETLLLFILSTLFFFVGGAWVLELPLMVGAFLAGISLSAFPTHMLVRGQLNSISDFFQALFFTALGAFLPWPSLGQFGTALALAALVLIVTPPLVAWIAEQAGFSARRALAAGLLLAQTSEFSLIIALQGLTNGDLLPETMTIIALVTMITIMATPLLATDRMNWRLLHLHPGRARIATESEGLEDHIVLLGCGRNGMGLLEHLVVTGNRIVAVDDDPVVLAQVEEAGVATVRGDVSDRRVLLAAGVPKARILVSTIQRVLDNEPALAMNEGAPFLIRTFGPAEADWVRERGGTPILYANATAEAFFQWMEAGEVPDTDEDLI